MIDRECEHHRQTVVAVHAKEADAHVAECAPCQDTALVVRVLDRLARTAAEIPPVATDPLALFRRSQFMARLRGDQRRAEQAARPLALAHIVAAGALAAGLVWLLLRTSGTLSLSDLATTTGVARALSGVLLWPLAVAGIATLAAARILWIED